MESTIKYAFAFYNKLSIDADGTMSILQDSPYRGLIVTTKVEQREDPGTEERENVDLPTLKREMEKVDAEIRRVQFEVETLEVELQKYLVQKQID
ncbi:hypothetical protein QYM36_011500 [Artemia franciscana]|uniref:Uncharacterized protein n=1 Tax=Artemia franciscana TaxID=6661 RepID=A0AA88HKC5_ARTSF|nr:hypothetical protein QYM36_011500 [Artemia franciscana]